MFAVVVDVAKRTTELDRHQSPMSDQFRTYARVANFGKSLVQ
jgi:hypothetical protein